MLNFRYKFDLGKADSVPSAPVCTEPVAIHTSATSATGTASSSSEYGAGYEAWRAFDRVLDDGNNGGWFTKRDVVQAQINYEFTEPRKVIRIRFYTPQNIDRQIKEVTLDTSDNGVDWVTRKTLSIKQYNANLWSDWYVGTAPVVSKYVRVNVLENWGDIQYTHIPEIEMDLEIDCPLDTIVHNGTPVSHNGEVLTLSTFEEN